MPSIARGRLKRHHLVHLLLAGFLAAAGWALWSRRDDLGVALARLDWASVAAALVVGLLAVLALLMSWAAAVRDGGVELPLRDLVRIYAIGQVGKYVPGSVWPVVMQAQLARSRGASPLRVASGSLLALAISICVALAVGGALLPLSGDEARDRFWWVPLVALPALAGLHPKVLNRLLGWASRVLRRGSADFSHTWAGITRCAAWALLGNALFGAHLFVMVRALDAGGTRGFLLSVAAYALASGIGVLVIFMPAGAGVREVVMTAVLAPVLSLDAALVIALVSRAVLVVVDLGLGLSQAVGLRQWSAPVEEQA